MYVVITLFRPNMCKNDIEELHIIEGFVLKLSSLYVYNAKYGKSVLTFYGF